MAEKEDQQHNSGEEQGSHYLRSIQPQWKLS